MEWEKVSVKRNGGGKEGFLRKLQCFFFRFKHTSDVGSQISIIVNFYCTFSITFVFNVKSLLKIIWSRQTKSSTLLNSDQLLSKLWEISVSLIYLNRLCIPDSVLKLVVWYEYNLYWNFCTKAQKMHSHLWHFIAFQASFVFSAILGIMAVIRPQRFVSMQP